MNAFMGSFPPPLGQVLRENLWKDSSSALCIEVRNPFVDETVVIKMAAAVDGTAVTVEVTKAETVDRSTGSVATAAVLIGSAMNSSLETMLLPGLVVVSIVDADRVVARVVIVVIATELFENGG